MSRSALRRLGGLFVEPAQDTAGPVAPVRERSLQVVGVIAPGEHLGAAAGGVATTLRRRASARTAVICRPGAPAALGGAGRRNARAIARKLVDRGIDAEPAGALCQVSLPPDARDAARDVWHVTAAVDVPVVVALPGRLEGFDDLLAQLDQLVLCAPTATGATIVELALASLAALGPPTARTLPPAGVLSRSAAQRGLLAVPLSTAADPPPDDAPETEPESHTGRDVTQLTAARVGARP